MAGIVGGLPNIGLGSVVSLLLGDIKKAVQTLSAVIVRTRLENPAVARNVKPVPTAPKPAEAVKLQSASPTVAKSAAELTCGDIAEPEAIVKALFTAGSQCILVGDPSNTCAALLQALRFHLVQQQGDQQKADEDKEQPERVDNGTLGDLLKDGERFGLGAGHGLFQFAVECKGMRCLIEVAAKNRLQLQASQPVRVLVAKTITGAPEMEVYLVTAWPADNALPIPLVTGSLYGLPEGLWNSINSVNSGKSESSVLRTL